MEFMEVKGPILSVRCLVDDGHEMRIYKGGGSIRNTSAGKEVQFFEHAGVYYLKMKLDSPKGKPTDSVFNRCG